MWLMKQDPSMIGVQATCLCTIVVIIYEKDAKSQYVITERTTMAEGVQVRNPVRKDAVLGSCEASGGCICVTEENEILPGRDALAKLGFYVEPTSAIVWSALAKIGGYIARSRRCDFDWLWLKVRVKLG